MGRIVVTKDPDFTESSRIMLQLTIGDGNAKETFFRCLKSSATKANTTRNSSDQRTIGYLYKIDVSQMKKENNSYVSKDDNKGDQFIKQQHSQTQNT